MNKDLQAILNFIQQSTHLTDEEKNTISKSLKDADKELELTSLKLDRIEKVKRTTAILLEETIEELEQKRKAVEAQNRELEIESSLERVRTVAMSMNKPDDMLQVCRMIAEQLELLKVKEIRNVQTAIFYEAKGVYINYEFYAKHDKTLITEVDYNDHAVQKGFADQMLKGPNEIFTHGFTGKEVQDWYEYQKTTNVFIDTYLETASSLNYYWHSLGPVALGISTYTPLSEKDNILFKRFLKVFELAYRRYLDIEKAEAQATEAKIEASLERVRSNAMSMHSSEELSNTVNVFFRELKTLGVLPWRCGVGQIDEKTRITNLNSASITKDGEIIQVSGKLKQEGHPVLEGIYDHWKLQKEYFPVLKGKEIKSYYDVVNPQIAYPDYPADAIQHGYMTFFKEGFVFAWTEKKLTEGELGVFRKFTSVLSLTYRRFLDLKEAEAQSREAQIELALERVRARTMAMQHSGELAETASVLFKQLLDLGIRASQMRTCAIVTLKPDEPIGECWITKPDGDIIPQSFMVPYDVTSAYKTIYAAWKNGERFLVVHLSGDALVQHLAFLKKYANIPTQQFQALPDQPKETFTHAMFFSQGYLFIISNESLPEYHDIFKRFGAVFQQTYTRFLDLKKAEAQAKESQIQLALERVRARTMAMQKSDELSEAVYILFQQFRELGENPDQATIGIINENEWVIEYWVTMYGSQMNRVFKFSIDEPNVTNRIYKAWKEQKKSLVIDLGGKELYDFATYRASMGGAAYNEAENRRVINVAFFSKGLINVQSTESRSVESIRLLERFAAVFEQTYTRFLDLQKAEAQAGEAKIEAALERVRSRSMGMQKSEELKEVIQVVYEQFVYLHIHVEHTGFIIDYKERNDMLIWLADKHAVPFQVTIPYFDSAHWNSFNESKEKRTDFFTNHLDFEEKNKFYQDLFKHIPEVPEETKKYYFSCPGLAISTVLLENIGLYIENFSGIPYSDEENNTLMRFGKVFQQTYTRFLDLQKAEAQALEAIKRASVDRVRAEIASMRTTNDLEKITPLIWNELTVLDIPFIRCGVFIMDEEQQQAQTFLYTEGKTIASFTSTFSNNRIITDALPYWRRKEIYKAHWDEAAFLEQAKSLVEQGAITASEKYLTENRPTDLYLHFLPFLQGMLYVGDAASLSNEHLQLVQALADAFSTAYARYEDFNKLESANIKIEKTLVDLKQTQAQLVQSEKMASLGELTAGIAHEIQNPLNFVNNFSEVSNELINEMVEEVDKGNTSEVKTIAEDVKHNLEKILHHGKRADAIVKGMLQHSRSSKGAKEPTDINALADEYLRLAYHGLRAKEKSFNATLITDLDAGIGKINIIPQDIGRVLLNLYNNAFYAVNEKKKNPPPPQAGVEYEPTVTVSTKLIKVPSGVELASISVKDNGNGIPEKAVAKIFQPFFTTKPTGQGTGLGLSLSYDIIKAHGGEIKVETSEGNGSKFIIQLPVV